MTSLNRLLTFPEEIQMVDLTSFNRGFVFLRHSLLEIVKLQLKSKHGKSNDSGSPQSKSTSRFSKKKGNPCNPTKKLRTSILGPNQTLKIRITKDFCEGVSKELSSQDSQMEIPKFTLPSTTTTDNAKESEKSTETTISSEAVITQPMKKLSLFELFNSTGVTLRAQPGNIKLRLKKFNIILCPDQYSVCTVDDTKLTKSKTTKKIRRDTTTTSEYSDYEYEDQFFSDDCIDDDENPFNRSDDSDYTPRKHRRKDKNKLLRKREKSKPSKSVQKKSRAIRQISSSSEEDGTINTMCPNTSDVLKSRSNNKSIWETRSIAISESTKVVSQHKPLRKRILRKSFQKNVYVESEESSGNNDPDFNPIVSPEKNNYQMVSNLLEKGTTATAEQSKSQQGEESLLEAEKLALIPGQNDVPTPDIQEKIHDVTSLAQASFSESEALITASSTSDITIDVNLSSATLSNPLPIFPAQSPTINSNFEPDSLQNFEKQAGSAPTPSTEIIPALGATINPIHDTSDTQRSLLESSLPLRIDVGRRNSDSEGTISTSEISPSLERCDDIQLPPTSYGEELVQQTQCDGNGKTCPYCKQWVPYFKLNDHGSMLHANYNLEPFLYSCNSCEPQKQFQTLVTLIDHMEVRHSLDLTTAPSTTPRTSSRNPDVLTRADFTPEINKRKKSTLQQTTPAPTFESSQTNLLSAVQSLPEYNKNTQRCRLNLVLNTQIQDSLKRYTRHSISEQLLSTIYCQINEILNRLFHSCLEEEHPIFESKLDTLKSEIDKLITQMIVSSSHHSTTAVSSSSASNGVVTAERCPILSRILENSNTVVPVVSNNNIPSLVSQYQGSESGQGQSIMSLPLPYPNPMGILSIVTSAHQPIQQTGVSKLLVPADTLGSVVESCVNSSAPSVIVNPGPIAPRQSTDATSNSHARGHIQGSSVTTVTTTYQSPLFSNLPNGSTAQFFTQPQPIQEAINLESDDDSDSDYLFCTTCNLEIASVQEARDHLIYFHRSQQIIQIDML